MKKINKLLPRFIISLLIMPALIQASVLPTLRAKFARACARRAALPKNARTYKTNAFDRTAATAILGDSRQPLTLHDYFVLSQGQKNAAHELAEEELSVKMGSELVAHPTLDKAKRAELVDEAVRLGSEHPTHEIYGLGQSPSFLIETARAHAQLTKQNPSRFKHVAFSGSFFAPHLTGRHGTLTFEKDKAAAPTSAQADAYRDYLYTLNLTAQQIAQAKHKTLIVDNVVTGGGLASFLHVLNFPPYSALRAKLEKNLELRVYPAQNRLQPLNFDFETERVTDHPTIVEEFGHWRHLDSIRLVPFFDRTKWTGVNPFSYRIPLAAQLACFKMIDHLATTPRAVKK